MTEEIQLTDYPFTVTRDDGTTRHDWIAAENQKAAKAELDRLVADADHPFAAYKVGHTLTDR